MPEPRSPEARAALERAVEHFNQGRYHDALDEFEVPYHEEAERRGLYLGLIRAAAALYHFERGQHLSARRLYRSARDLLEREAQAGGTGSPVDAALLVGELDLAFAPLLAAPEGKDRELRPAFRPRILRRP